ncbi:hypothetical protein ACNKHW_16895 [Shigella flexneri]
MWPSVCHATSQKVRTWELTYGTSNTGRFFKTLYREGLKNRYGALMQTISGVHYNFSCQCHSGKRSVVISRALMAKRKFLRLFPRYPQLLSFRLGHSLSVGASPAICSLSCKENQHHCR